MRTLIVNGNPYTVDSYGIVRNVHGEFVIKWDYDFTMENIEISNEDDLVLLRIDMESFRFPVLTAIESGIKLVKGDCYKSPLKTIKNRRRLCVLSKPRLTSLKN